MEIVPIAFESFGVRSMATLVNTDEVSIMIDPAAALGPSRWRLPPHEKELNRLDELWKDIRQACKKCDIMIVTHYHYDHHDPNQPELYDGKDVFLKHPTENINKSQKGRAETFLENLGDLPEDVTFCDGQGFAFGSTEIKFSPAVPHGTNDKLGYVIEVLVDDGDERMIHTSDVEGPSLEEQVNFILENNPNYLILDGPLSYMLGFRYSKKSLQLSVENMIRVMKECPVSDFMVDHHFLRDPKWKERAERAIEYAKDKKVNLGSAAEFAGKENSLLEAHRRELYGKK